MKQKSLICVFFQVLKEGLIVGSIRFCDILKDEINICIDYFYRPANDKIIIVF